jgi:hypothetical protein
MHDARAVFRAIDGWRGVADADDWAHIVEKTQRDIESGEWLISQLGAERYLDPPMIAALMLYRRKLLHDDCGDQPTATDLMLIDMAIVTYYRWLQVQGWIGNAAIWTEREFFSNEGLTVKWKERNGTAAAYTLNLDDRIQRLVEELFPLLDRLNRALSRNLRTIRAMHTKATPAVVVAQAGQVNVAENQANSVVSGVAVQNGIRAVG